MSRISIVLILIFVLCSCGEAENGQKNRCDDQFFIQRLSMDYTHSGLLREQNDSLYHIVSKIDDDSLVYRYREFSDKNLEFLDELEGRVEIYVGGRSAKTGALIEPCMKVEDFFYLEMKQSIGRFFKFYNDKNGEYQQFNAIQEWEKHADFIFSYLNSVESYAHPTLPEMLYEDITAIQLENILINVRCLMLINERNYYLHRLMNSDILQ